MDERKSMLHKEEDRIRVLIADDCPVTRAGIRAILETAQDIDIVGEAQNGTEAQSMVAVLQPSILLLDFVMPGNHALEVERWTREQYPETITLILTAHDRDAYLSQAVEAQVSGYLLKEQAQGQLVESIRCAARGECLISGDQLARARRWQATIQVRWDSLTAQEQEVLTQLARGKTNQQLAEALHVALRTVETHIQHILSRLEIASTREASAWVWKHGFVEGEDPST